MDGEHQKSPSDKWSAFSDSELSSRHLSPDEKEHRGSNCVLTMANMFMMYLGITFMSLPKSISKVGICGAIIGFTYTVVINLYGIYLLLKARNRFKNERISDICELSVKLYGEWTRPWVSLLVVAITAMYLICFVIFFGTEIDQLLCQTFKVAQCGNNIKYTLLVRLNAFIVLASIP